MFDPVSAILIGTLGSSIANIFGSQSAAKKQSAAAQQANFLMMQQQQRALEKYEEALGLAKGSLQPFIDMGTQASGQLSSRLGDLTAPIELTQDWLEKTPGYQFTKEQGMRAVTGQNVLRGLSGAQMKGAANFVTGLADQTYKTQFDVANINKTNAFNRLLQSSQLGAQAGQALGSQAMAGAGNILSNAATVGGQMGSNLIGAGNAKAAAQIALGQNLGNIAQIPIQSLYANQLFNNPQQPAGPIPYLNNPWNNANYSTGIYGNA